MKQSINKKNILDIGSLFLSQFATVILAFITQVLLVRLLSVEEFGSFSTGLAVSSIIATIVGFGVGPFLVRVFSVENEKASRWIQSMKKIMFFSILIGITVNFSLAFFSSYSLLTKQIILIFIGVSIYQGTTLIVYSIFQVKRKFRAISAYDFWNFFLRFLIVLLGVFLNLSIYELSFGYFFISIIFLIIFYKIIKHFFRENYIESYNDETLLDTLKAIWPFAFSGIFYLFYYQSGTVVLGLLNGEASVAIYSVLFTALSVVYIVPNVVYQKFLLPIIHKWSATDVKKMYDNTILGVRFMALISIIVMGFVAICAVYLIPIIFSERYILAGQLLVLAVLAIPFRFIATSVGSILVTGDLMKKKVIYQGIVAFINIITNIILISFLSLQGAVYNIILTEFLTLFIYTLAIKRNVNQELFNKILSNYLIICLLIISQIIIYFFYLSNFKSIILIPIILISIVIPLLLLFKMLIHFKKGVN